MAMPPRRIASAALRELIDYDRQCLALERQGEVTLSDAEFFGASHRPPRLHTLDHLPEDWHTLLSLPPALKALEQAKRQAEQVVLFVPIVLAFREWQNRRRLWEPVAGVFCAPQGQRLRPDPSDLYLSQWLTAEMSPDEVAELRASLETAARQSPLAFCQAIQNLLAQKGMTPIASTRLETLDLPAAAFKPSFWVVGEPSYDRTLLDDLERLRSLNPSGTALDFLFRPPAMTAPSLDDVLLALANPIAPTLSQAIALAHAMRQPLTVITGPPGTGKTRLIVGLIIHGLLTGKAVLLASRINRAVDAAVELAERLMGKGCLLRTGNEQVRTELAQTLSELLDRTEWTKDGELFSSLPQTLWRLPSSSKSQEKLQRSADQLATLCQHLNGLARKLRPFGLRPAEGKWRRFWWQVRWHLFAGERRWRAFRTAWQQAETLLEQLESEWLPEARQVQCLLLHQRLSELLRRGREALQNLLTALNDRRARPKAFESLIRLGFPIAVSTLSVGQNFPLSAGMVDLLIVDEASSCDPASILPLLYRAKRAVIVGDPKQLDHVTKERWKNVKPIPQLRSAKGELVEASFGTSAFNLIHRLVDEQTFWLIDHFRCPPPIIAFSNDAFYGGRLRIHTIAHEAQPIVVQRVNGLHRERQNSLTNPAQLQAAWDWLLRWAQQHPKRSLGLVAPYRAFIDDAMEQLQSDERLAPLRERWEREQLIIGTAHRFQGSEVDYLVFATVAGDNATDRHRRWVEFPNLFNVAITRARRQLVILVSPVFEKRLVLTQRLLRATLVALRDLPDLNRSFAQQVSDELNRLGIPHRLGCSFHGDLVDLLDEGEEPRWGALLCGWDEAMAMTPLEFMALWERRKMLRRRRLQVRLVFPPDFDELLATLLPLRRPKVPLTTP
ncbi:MAG: AAA domain-containing protein [Armatimonadota bacterium]|nr:AAA domain-containing protein [Armatimonadota bacterium]